MPEEAVTEDAVPGDCHPMLAPDGPWLRPFAHRGLHGPGRPEDSLAAFQAAINHDYGIELDVQPARDGETMIFHDPALRRMTGRQGLVREFDAATLSTMSLLDTVEVIPRLSGLLQLVAGKVPLLIEMKDQTGDLSPGDDGLAQAVVATLDGYAGPVALMSFNPSLVAAAHRLRPDLPVGLVSCGFRLRDWPTISARRRAHLRKLADFDAVGASFISHDRRNLGNPAVAALKARGVPVATWTIRSAKAAAAAFAAGADIITFEGYLP